MERSFARYRPIGERGLFRRAGSDSEDLPPPEPLEEELVESQLRIRLLGTIASTVPEMSVAAVENQNTRTKLFVRPGDELAAGARVVRIERKLLVLENRGQLEKISLDEEKNGGSAGRKAQAPKGRKNRAGSPAARRSRRKPPGFLEGGVSMSERIQLLREVSEQKRGAARAQSILTQARIVPRYGEDGVLTGLQLSAIRPESLLEAAGFQNGDLVIEVNGTELSDPSQGLKVFRELESAERFEVDVEREGQILTIEYEAELP